MSASAEIKDKIARHYEYSGITTSVKDWKRLSKRSVSYTLYGNSHTTYIREFENSKIGIKCSVVGDEDDTTIIENGEWIYGVGKMSPHDPLSKYVTSGMYLGFAPRRFWAATGFMPDNHLGHGLHAFFGLPADIAESEDSENSFSVPANYNALTIHMALKKAGFVYDKAFDDFLQPGGAGGSSPTIPTSSLSGSGPSGGYYDTGLTAGSTKPSDFVFAVMKQTGESAVEVMITAYQDFLHDGGFDQEIASLVEVHLPSDWYEASEQCFFPGTMTAAEAFEYLTNAGFINDPKYSEGFTDGGSYVAYDPDAESDYSNQPQSVQDAIAAQHSAGQLGLPKANATWLEDHEFNAKYEDDDEEEFTLERSHALYVLYSIYDDGCHEVIPNFFGFSNDELSESMGSVIEGPEFEVVADRQVYAAPYDIPAPVAAPALTTVVAADDPSDEVDESVRIKNEPEKWIEFCQEIWDAYVARDISKPFNIVWSDNYRYRDATITGLAYRFKILEYTGIQIVAGFKLVSGEITTQFEVPDQVFADLFKEYGGDWNIGVCEQFIKKRTGVDEDGFSFSSSGLWDEVKPILTAAGWEEVE